MGSFLGHESSSVEIEDLMIAVIRSGEHRIPSKLQLIPLVPCEIEKVTSSRQCFVESKQFENALDVPT